MLAETKHLQPETGLNNVNIFFLANVRSLATKRTEAQCGDLSGNELTRNLSGNTRQQSSQLSEPVWTDPGILNGISVR